MRVLPRTLAAAVAVAAVWLCVPAAAQAELAIEPGSFTVSTSSDQAGAYSDLATGFALARNAAGGVGAILRNLEIVYPTGFAVYPVNVKTCDPAQLQFEQCPLDAQIGTLEVALRLLKPGGNENDGVYLVPIYNMVPPPGEAAVFGFVVHGTISGNIVLSVGPEYRGHASVRNLVSGTELLRESLTIWGVPADPVHDAQRGLSCEQFSNYEQLVEGEEKCAGGGAAVNEDPLPYLSNPTQCTSEPVQAELRGVESWEGERAPEGAATTANVGPFTGCESLKFPATIAVAPEESQAITPTGYAIALRVPQSEGAEGLATADLRDTVVRMPPGVVLSPSATTGLESCSEAQVGFGTENPVECPNASKLGEVSVITPALTGELKGFLYLGGPPSGVITKPPFTVYMTIAGHGVLVKIRGSIYPNPATGQLTATFDENPQLPLSELKLQLNGGSRATVANPGVCEEYNPATGSIGAKPYSAEGDLVPWSTPFDADATPLSFPFYITGCPSPRFDPSFTAGTVYNQAGGYSPFSLSIAREDADEQLGGLTLTTPPGLLGNLSKVPLCGEPQAAEGICPEASLIGEVTASAGPGPEPVFIRGGRVYVTGPYDGAPFGLSIDVSETAGPLDLGTGPCNCEVVRATVSVNPQTAQLTVSSGALPRIKDGVPLQVKTLDIELNRPEFVFNPTSCDPLSVDGTLASVQGTPAHDSTRFQVTNCAALGFKPSFKVSTSAKTSRTDGASLLATLTYPSVGGHSTLAAGEANIAKAKFDLPKQLPSRLTTLQKACVAAQFEANPAGCPAASVVGIAEVRTPIFPVPLEGPVYFVSHGGETFPSLIFILQGYGVTLEILSTTFIDNAGVTSATLKTIPDAPVSSFELYLPEGPYSALAAIGNLCTGKLTMPTAFVAQDGAEIHQNTKVAVTGCHRTESADSKRRKRKKR